VERIYDAAKVRAWRDHDDWLDADVARTVADASKDALFVVPAEGYVGTGGKGDKGGTGHGTPWPSDREVVVSAFGTGVHPHHGSEVVAQDRVAATLAAFLGIHWSLPARPLEGAPSPAP
jgi:hypothetical protein